MEFKFYKVTPSTLMIDSAFKYAYNNNEISMIGPCSITLGLYELYCIQGNYFEDVIRFNSKEGADLFVLYLFNIIPNTYSVDEIMTLLILE